MVENLPGLMHPHHVGLAMLRPLEATEAIDVLHLNGPGTLARLNELGMAVHEARDGTHWVGYTDPSMSNHDRWLAVGDPAHSAEHWRLVRTEWHDTYDNIFSHLIHVSIVMQQVGLDLGYAASVNGLRVAQGKAAHELFKVSAYMNIFDTIEAPPIATLGDWDLAELHDLVHHYPEWVAEHPEVGDLPRELVWRMHGLQALLPTLMKERELAV